MPNALLHELLTKVPETDADLRLQKKTYEKELYKSEMHGTAPPWTIKQLIDNIAVDLACAPPGKEVAAADIQTSSCPHSHVSLRQLWCHG